MFAFEFPEAPFKRIREVLMELHIQYFRLEHITQLSQAMDDYGPGNMLRELSKRTD